MSGQFAGAALDDHNNSDMFDQARADFENSAMSPQYVRWANEALEAFAFYDGIQLTDDERSELIKNGQIPVVVNKIQSRINNVTAIEIRSRTKMKFRARSNDKGERDMGEALSDIAYYVQDKQESTSKFSRLALYSRICGVAWHEFDVQEGQIIEAVDKPFMFVWDTGDMSPDLSDSNFVCKMWWMGIEEAVNRFPDHEEYLRGLDTGLYSHRSVDVPEGVEFAEEYTADYVHKFFRGGYYDSLTRRVLIVEYQYRKNVKIYEVITKSDRVIETFEKDEAYRLAKDKDSVTQRMGMQVWSLFFTNDRELYNEPLPHQPNKERGDFLYTPYVINRELVTGVPYGIVRNAIDPQRLYNKTLSKLKWLEGSRQVTYESTAVRDPAKLALNAAKPTGMIEVKDGKLNSIRFERHDREIASHFQSLQRHDQDIQDALGIYDESLGIQTNASSGRAIQQRQIGTVNTHIQSLDRLRSVKVKYGYKLMRLIRAVFTDFTVMKILDDEGRVKEIRLNEYELDPETRQPIKDEDGNVILSNDISVGKYDLFVEEVPDSATQMEEARDKVLQAFQSGLTPELIVQYPGWLEFFGVPRSTEIYQQLTKQSLTDSQNPDNNTASSQLAQQGQGAAPGGQTQGDAAARVFAGGGASA